MSQAAVNSFMESGADQGGQDHGMYDDSEDEPAQASVPASLAAPTALPAASSVPSGGYTLSGAPAPPLPAGWGSNQAASSNPSSRSSTPRNPFRSNAGPRVSGFRELNSTGSSSSSSRPPGSGSGARLGRVQHGNDDDDERDENDPQSFFTGGEKR